MTVGLDLLLLGCAWPRLSDHARTDRTRRQLAAVRVNVAAPREAEVALPRECLLQIVNPVLDIQAQNRARLPRSIRARGTRRQPYMGSTARVQVAGSMAAHARQRHARHDMQGNDRPTN